MLYGMRSVFFQGNSLGLALPDLMRFDLSVGCSTKSVHPSATLHRAGSHPDHEPYHPARDGGREGTCRSTQQGRVGRLCVMASFRFLSSFGKYVVITTSGAMKSGVPITAGGCFARNYQPVYIDQTCLAGGRIDETVVIAQVEWLRPAICMRRTARASITHTLRWRIQSPNSR